MQNPADTQARGQVRHWIGVAGTILVTLGVLDASEAANMQNIAMSVAGAISTLWVMVDSWRSKV